jgi:hypothetical protein
VKKSFLLPFFFSVFHLRWFYHVMKYQDLSLWVTQWLKSHFYPSTGGVTETPCPYKCISDRFHMPHCYTALEELVYTFGGPWLFGLILLGILILLALVLSVARMKYVGGDEIPALVPAQPVSRIDHSFPFLESLNEVCLQFLPFASHAFSSDMPDQIYTNLWSLLRLVTHCSKGDNLFFRFWKQIEPRNCRVMCIGCTSWGQILSRKLGIYLTPLLNK